MLVPRTNEFSSPKAARALSSCPRVGRGCQHSKPGVLTSRAWPARRVPAHRQAAVRLRDLFLDQRFDLTGGKPLAASLIFIFLMSKLLLFERVAWGRPANLRSVGPEPAPGRPIDHSAW